MIHNVYSQTIGRHELYDNTGKRMYINRFGLPFGSKRKYIEKVNKFFNLDEIHKHIEQHTDLLWLQNRYNIYKALYVGFTNTTIDDKMFNHFKDIYGREVRKGDLGRIEMDMKRIETRIKNHVSQHKQEKTEEKRGEFTKLIGAIQDVLGEKVNRSDKLYTMRDTTDRLKEKIKALEKIK